MFDEEPDPDPHGECLEEITRLTNQRDHALDDLKAEIANHREDLVALEAMRETAKESSRVHVEMHNQITKLTGDLVAAAASYAGTLRTMEGCRLKADLRIAELEKVKLDFQNAVSVGKKFESRLEALRKRIFIYEEAMVRIGSNESIMRGAEFCQNLAIETLKQQMSTTTTHPTKGEPMIANGIAAKTSSQTEEEYKSLRCSIEGLESRISALGDRLSGVLREVPPPATKGEPDCPLPSLVPLADSIRNARFAVEDQSRRVSSWLDRIEL